MFQRILGMNTMQKQLTTPPSSANASVPADIELNVAKPIRQGVLVLGFGFGLFLLWAAFAPLDEGVPTQGQVNIERKSIVIQHLTGGIVKRVYVNEGQFVRKGDILMTLDDDTTKARYEEVRQQYLGLRSSEGRLQSEKQGRSDIQFHPDLANASADPTIQAKLTDQKNLLTAKQQLLQADLAQLQQNIQAERAAISGNRSQLASKQNELDLTTAQIQKIEPAVNQGYVAHVQLIDLQQRAAQLSGDISQINANIIKSERQVAELNSRMISRQETERRNTADEMTKVRLEVDADAQKFNALQDELQRTVIKAPVSGQVIGLQVHSAGTVIQSGQQLMTVVPKGETLLLDAKIPPQLIDRVQAGQKADVRFNSFAHTPQLVVDAKVLSISGDLINETNPAPEMLRQYYLARIEVTPAGMHSLGKRQLTPGMPVEIVIKTGERSMLAYVLHPLLKRLSASLKEE